MDKEQRSDFGRMWSAIEELRRNADVRQQKLETFEQYQRERNHEIISEVSKVDAKIELMRIDLQKHMIQEESLNKSFLKKGLWVLGAMVSALIVYIWQNTVGHPIK